MTWHADDRQPVHKALHKSNFLRKIFAPSVVSDPDSAGHFNPYPTYPYTGSVKPVYPLSPRRDVPAHIKSPEYADDGNPKAERKARATSNIAILNAEEQEAMRKVCRLAREVLDIVAREAKPGVTTDYLDEICHRECLARDVNSLEVPAKLM
jgi:methionyl aminopeptidase